MTTDTAYRVGFILTSTYRVHSTNTVPTPSTLLLSFTVSEMSYCITKIV